MFKKNWNGDFYADTKEDLDSIKGEIGTEAIVIKDSARYRLMSTGEWVKQVAPGEDGSSEVDLTGYATEIFAQNKANEALTASKKYTDKEIKKIEIPSVEGLAKSEDLEKVASDPVFKMFGATNLQNPAHEQYGIYVRSSDNKSLADAMVEAGTGMYNFWIQDGSLDMPQKANEKGSSMRGLCCVDYFSDANNWYGWILAYDQDCDCYLRYIRRGAISAWKHILTE